MLTERPEQEAEAFPVAIHLETPPPHTSPSHRHAENFALRSVHLDDVPLLDSPAWSSDDELDNPTYNKRFRHKKHEEIRRLLIQKRLEEREWQQLAKAQRHTSAQQPCTEDVAAAAAATKTGPDSRCGPSQTSSGASSRTSSFSRSLERTKNGRSKRASHSADGSSARCARDDAISKLPTAGMVGATTSITDAAASLSPTPMPVTGAPPPSEVGPNRSAKSQPKAAAAEHTKSSTTIQEERAALVPPAPTPDTQLTSLGRQERTSDNSPHSASPTQRPATVSAVTTPSFDGTPPPPRPPSVPAPAPLQIPLDQDAPRSNSAKGQTNTTSSPAVLSSTEVRLPKTRGSHPRTNRFFVSKIVKGSPKHSTTAAVSGAASITAASAVPTAPLRAAAKVAASQYATTPYPSPLNVDVCEVVARAGLDATCPYVGSNLSTEGQHRADPPQRGTAATAEATDFMPVPPPSPPPFSTAPQKTHVRRSITGRHSPFNPSASPAAAKCERLPSARDRQSLQPSKYNLRGMPSCFQCVESVPPYPGRPISAETTTAQGHDAIGRPSRCTPNTMTTAAMSTITQWTNSEDRNGLFRARDSNSSHGAADDENDGAAARGGSSDRCSESWRDVRSPASAGSDVDYILEYHSSYYGDLWKLLDSPPSRETFSEVGSTENRRVTGVDSAAAAVLSKPERDLRRRDAAVAHFPEITRVATKPTPTDSRRLVRNSASSIDRGLSYFYSGEMHRAATPAVYSFFTSPPTNGEAEMKPIKKASLLPSRVSFGKDPYALGLEDSMAELRTTEPNKRAAAETSRAAAKLPHIQNGGTRRAAGFTTADDDWWEYPGAKGESCWSVHPPLPTVPSDGQKKSSMTSAKYSLLSSKKSFFALREAKETKAAAIRPIKPPARGSASVRVLSLQGPLQSSLPYVGLCVPPLPLNRSASQTDTAHKSLDLLSLLERKTTATPEGFLPMPEDEEKAATPPTHFIAQQQQWAPTPEIQQGQSPKQKVLSFAGLPLHSPAAFQPKQKAPPAAKAVPTFTSSNRHIEQTEAEGSAQPISPSSCNHLLLTKTLPPFSPRSTSKPTARPVSENATAAERKAPPVLEDAHRQSPYDVYLPVPCGEVGRFRSLIGSTYLSDVYTSSLRQLTGGYRTSAKSVTDTTAMEGQTTPMASHDGVGETPGVLAKATSTAHPADDYYQPPPPLRMRLPAPPAAQPNAVPSVPSTADANCAAPPLPSASAARALVPVEWSVGSSRSSSRSVQHRNRQRHLATRIGHLVEAALCGSSNSSAADGAVASPVHIAAQGSEGDSSSHSRVPYSTAPPYDGESAGGPTEVVRKSTMVDGSNAGTGTTTAINTAKCPTEAAMEVAPLSVSALVQRLEARMSANASPVAALNTTRSPKSPQAGHPSSNSKTSPVMRVGAATSNNVADVTEENGSTTPRPNAPTDALPPSVLRKSNNKNTSSSSNNNDLSSSSKTNPIPDVLAPMRLAKILKQSTLPPPRAITRRVADPRHNDRADRQSNSVHTHTDEPKSEHGVPQRSAAPSSPMLPPVPPLAEDMLMHQRSPQHGAILYSPTLPPIAPRPTAQVPLAKPQKQPKRLGRDSGADGPTGGLHTTADLLTRITVKGGTRGWRGGRESSIVATLDSSSTARRPIRIADHMGLCEEKRKGFNGNCYSREDLLHGE
ncbi:hypothetical protein ABB37_00058 [Leptomonas pyrrhocoris]|uniref:Uncharacterized protein n=1 Tax=Leptomonas pyrrhocoris TaxID=157538 RepID=A0A0N0DZU0_LEPPY|nr:hypothetical protein ABB37_00058 [Leptomonas pyrrhocoris]KPA85665.1 hypothetical protein ABB37_00058 [Leptomonas pyrrhocoris]|eukprot:XP_015664104.1 hypothetical protein ABB37_00058 [Leptomonas pyrrhocoris]